MKSNLGAATSQTVWGELRCIFQFNVNQIFGRGAAQGLLRLCNLEAELQVMAFLSALPVSGEAQCHRTMGGTQAQEGPAAKPGLSHSAQLYKSKFKY